MMISRTRTAIDVTLRDAATWLFTVRYRTKSPDYFRHWDDVYASLRTIFQEPYGEYTKNVSSPVATISLELACFLYFMCDHIRPRLIVDLGSGFSSYVFRLFQQDHHVNVLSVDDDPFWLECTKDFLLRHRLRVDNLYLWDQVPIFEGQSHPSLILHDLGNPQRRIDTLAHLLRFIPRSGHIILDDMHKVLVRNRAIQWIRKHTLGYVNLAPYTQDRFGRFQWYIPVG